MIFPEITLEEWLERYPDLAVRKERCNGCCKKFIKTNKPFIEKDWVGLAAICECGFHGASSMLPRSQEMKELVSNLFFSID